MKIVFLGGGTGGHFYPLIAIARALRKEAELENIARTELFFLSDSPQDPDILFRERIKFLKINAGKIRRYFSLAHPIEFFKIILGIISAFWKLYFLLPDIIFSKGGYASFPVLVAVKMLRIPLIIHESDTVPGIVNQWAGKWADRIAVSFPETAKYFSGKNIAVIGNPIRSQVIGGNLSEAIEYFKLEEALPTILVLGGSQGSERVNEVILAVVEEAVKNYQIIHQTGKNNYADVSGRSKVLLEKSEYRHRYHPYPFFEEGELRSAYRMASLIVSRAGAGSIFEIAAVGAPSILIPLPEAAQNHQRENAYAYARAGACEVIEETNLTPHLLLAEMIKILSDPAKQQRMKLAAESFARLDAADKIAKEIIKLGIHE